MPSCCIKQCSAKKNKNQQTLSFHRFPANKPMKKKWSEVINSENIKPTLKTLFVCSLHFNETSFNRTLGVVRLRDDAVPSSSLLPSHTRTESTLESTLDSQPNDSATISDEISEPIIQARQGNVASEQISYEISKPIIEGRQGNVASEQILLEKNEKISRLAKQCDKLKNKVRSLNEMVRRRDKKIALLSHIMMDLQRKHLLKRDNKYFGFRRVCRTRILSKKTNS